MMNYRQSTLAITLGIAILAGGPALAGQPDSPGQSAAKKSSAATSARSPAQNAGYQGYFNNERSTLIRDYYSNSMKSGNCPPGLAKKNNGCQPPGQAKQWRRGEPLPRDLVYYDLPGALIGELGRTPEGEKIIRVDDDLLLINIATGMVLDALEIQ
jgi:Ni/Co efflux regulator RcnB